MGTMEELFNSICASTTGVHPTNYTTSMWGKEVRQCIDYNADASDGFRKALFGEFTSTDAKRAFNSLGRRVHKALGDGEAFNAATLALNAATGLSRAHLREVLHGNRSTSKEVLASIAEHVPGVGVTQEFLAAIDATLKNTSKRVEASKNAEPSKLLEQLARPVAKETNTVTMSSEDFRLVLKVHKHCDINDPMQRTELVNTLTAARIPAEEILALLIEA